MFWLLIQKWQTVREWHERYHCDIWREFFLSLWCLSYHDFLLLCVYASMLPQNSKSFWPWMNGFWKSKYSTIQILRNHPQKKILSLRSNHRLQALMILHFRRKSTERKPAKELSKRDCTSPIWAIVGNLHGISVTRWVKLWKNATNFLLRSFDPWYKIMHTLKSYLLFMKWL